MECLALSHIGTTLASGSWDKTARVWNMESYEQLFVLQGESAVLGLDFSADDDRLFTGSLDGKQIEAAVKRERELMRVGKRKSAWDFSRLVHRLG